MIIQIDNNNKKKKHPLGHWTVLIMSFVTSTPCQRKNINKLVLLRIQNNFKNLR